MAFPSTPTLGQQYTQDGRTWQWDGVAWEILALAGPAGPPGVISATAPLALASGVLTINLSNYLPVSGGTLDANSTIDASTATEASTFSGSGLDAALSANPSENSTFRYSGLQVQNFSGTMSVTAAGLTFPNFSTQTVAFPGFTGYAPLASPVFTGDARAVTPDTSDNDTSIATTAFVKAQGYLTSAPVTSVAGRTGAITLAVADVSGAAPLASPSFSGTPSLPTGTTAVTQSPGNNTTALATTAFVTAAVPAFATETQAIVGTSSTTTISPLTMRHILSNAGYTAHTSLVGNYSSYVSGSASVSTLWSNLVGLSVTAANGKVAFLPNSQVAYFPFTSRGKAELNLDWTKPVWFSFRFNYSSAAGIGNSNTVNRVTIGKLSSVFGDLTTKGFGVTWTAGTTGAFTVSAHNGTTLTTVASAVTVSNTTYFPTTSAAADFLVYSDGAGNITLFCNGVQVATTTGGPSSGNLVGGRYTFEADNTTSTSGTVACDYTGIRSMYSY